MCVGAGTEYVKHVKNTILLGGMNDMPTVNYMNVICRYTDRYIDLVEGCEKDAAEIKALDLSSLKYNECVIALQMKNSRRFTVIHAPR